jgi:hypothetical protein
MQGIIDFLLGDTGVLVAIIVGIAFLTITTYGLLISKGYVKVKATNVGGVRSKITSAVMGPQHSILFILGAFVVLVVGFASMGFWNQITTAAPYLSDASYNFVFISMVIILLVSMMSLAVVLMRLLGQLEYHKRANP